MTDRHRSARKGARRRGNADDGPDLFSQQIAKAVEIGFAKAAQEAGAPGETPGAQTVALTDRPVLVAPVASPALETLIEPAIATQLSPIPDPDADDPTTFLQARMLNQFVYCPRLFYYEHVEKVFVESADTIRGRTLHRRVDKGSGALPKARRKKSKSDEPSTDPTPADEAAGAPEAEEPIDSIHSRSVELSSTRLGVIAKMDLIEAEVGADGETLRVCPVDYKAGSPRETDGALDLWDGDRMQLGLQCLILRDHGYACDEGVIYYRGTKQRVSLAITAELESWILGRIAAASETARGAIPAPLVDSPKCRGCSLAPVCLPDETRLLALSHQEDSEENGPLIAFPRGSRPPRTLVAPRDERRALYLNTHGVRVGCSDGVLQIKEENRIVDEIRVMDVAHVALFGNIQISTQAVHRLCDEDIPLTYFSGGCYFKGLTRGHSLKNVFLRIEQFRHAADPAACLQLARQFVHGKIHNHRVMFMRNHLESQTAVRLRLREARRDALAADSLSTLLGIEGAAAHLYFQNFGGLLRVTEDRDNGGDEHRETPQNDRLRRFDFNTRNRRPPTDPVNALLSLAYSPSQGMHPCRLRRRLRSLHRLLPSAALRPSGPGPRRHGRISAHHRRIRRPHRHQQSAPHTRRFHHCRTRRKPQHSRPKEILQRLRTAHDLRNHPPRFQIHRLLSPRARAAISHPRPRPHRRDPRLHPIQKSVAGVD